MPAAALVEIENSENDLIFSSASLWEVAIKQSLGRPDFTVDPHLLRRGLLDNGYRELAITGEHAVGVGVLPAIHKDPFDRILISQAIVEEITLITVDEMIARYPAPVRCL
ncbi:MAG: type II toxin-antitoxin system VapC family toxin [Pararhizobium sp.]